jgi:hypothetical protein
VAAVVCRLERRRDHPTKWRSVKQVWVAEDSDTPGLTGEGSSKVKAEKQLRRNQRARG